MMINAGHYRILLVEDNPGDVRLIRELLRGRPEFEVSVAGCIAEGLALRPAGGFDVVLLDLNLPDSRGIDTVRRLHESNHLLPIIVLTGLEDEELAVKTLQSGAQEYLVKGRITHDALVRTVRYAVERARSSLTLIESERKLGAILDGSRDGILLAEVESRKFIMANSAICRMLGYTREELLELGVGDIHPAESIEKVREAFNDQLAGKMALALDIPMLRKDGTTFISDINSSPVTFEGKYCLLGMFRDVSERKAAENALREAEAHLRMAQRLESIGRLAGGVAHDFNNILCTIRAYCDLVMQAEDGSSQTFKRVEKMRNATERAEVLTRQLLAFGRRQLLNPAPFDLNSALKERRDVLQRLLGEDIMILMSLSPNVPIIIFDPSQFEQVLMNLVTNARDAMPHGGTLSITTTNIHLDDDYTQMHRGVQPGWYALMAIGDTGTGIGKDDLEKIFEPFYTTKPQGRGTGLGLSTVYGITKQSGGNVWVYSEIGKGTVVKVYFPCEGCASLPAPQTGTPSTGLIFEDRKTNILIAEDDEDLRNILVDSLAAAGHRILEAGNGAEAMNVAEKFGERIDLLLTDVVMPVMNGVELAGRLAKFRPDLRVLFMSGYSDHALLSRDAVPAGRLIEKPFSIASLVRRVREELDVAE